MEKLKVKVGNEAESKVVQDLFFDLGYSWACGKKENPAINECPTIIRSHESGCMTWSMRSEVSYKDHKEITIPELRDLVVLNRNDRNDRTHTDQDNWSWFISSNGTGYVFGAGNANGLHQWDESSLDMVDLKPIEKKEMKELKQAKFLVKTDSGYVLQVLDENSGGADVVRIPDGSEWAKLWDEGEIYQCIEFYKEKNEFFSNTKKVWMRGHDQRTNKLGQPARIIWQRETLNDQVASASSQGQSQFPLSNYELNHRVAKAFNAVRGTDLNEDDVNYLRELIDLTISHYGERK